MKSLGALSASSLCLLSASETAQLVNSKEVSALEVMDEFADTGYPAKIRERTLIVVPGRDEIASTAASRTFAIRSGAVSHIIIAGAKHELLMEQDHYRAQFWSAFDSFSG